MSDINETNIETKDEVKNEAELQTTTKIDAEKKALKPRKKKHIFLKLLLIVVALPILLGLILTVQFFIQKQTAWDFIPKQFQAYLQVESISKIYADWKDLEAMPLAFREIKGLSGLEKSLLSLKASGINKSSIFNALIDVEAHVVLNRSGEAIVVLDLGYRSTITRQFNLFADFIKYEGLTVLKKDGLTIFQYNWNKGAANSNVFIEFKDNLALVTFKQDALIKLHYLKEAKESLSDREKTRISDAFAQTNSGSLRFLADPKALSDSFMSDSAMQKRLNESLIWSDATLVSLDITNDAFSMQASTIVESKQEAVAKILSHKNSVLNSLRSIPVSSYFYTAISLGDFRELMQVWALFSGQDLTSSLKMVEEGSKALLGMNTDELFWSWAGEEAGMLYLGANGDAVFHIKVRDEGKRSLVFRKLNESAVVDIDKRLVLDNVPINRIVIPDFFKGIISLFGVNFDTPYYIVLNDELFLSMNAENLSRLSNECREGKLLYRSPEFQELTANTGKNPAVFLYYDIDKSIPFFLKEANLLSKVLKLYNRGALSLFVDSGYLTLKLGAIRVEQKKTQAYPGFPIAMKGSLKSAPWVGYIPARSDPVIVAIQNDSELTLDAISDSERIFSVPVENGTRLVASPWKNEFLAWAPSGTFYRFSSKGQSIDPFPLLSSSQGSFLPVVMEDKILAYSRSDSALLSIGKDGSISKLSTEFADPVTTSPSTKSSIIAVAPKTFEGTVYLLDKDGRVRDGWPLEGGGISLSGPELIDTSLGQCVAFLTQNGKLSLWKLDGSIVEGFPIDLGGVFSGGPLVIKIANTVHLITIDQIGLVSIIKLDGSLSRKDLIGSENSEARVLAYDMEGDGTDEIFIYGGKNTVDGFNANFERLPGFPVKGSYRPQFVDLNLDGKAELVSGSWDGNIYAYTLKK